MRLLFYGHVAQENSEKIREINWTEWDFSVPPGKVSSGTKFGDFSQKTSINSIRNQQNMDEDLIIASVFWFAETVLFRASLT